MHGYPSSRYGYYPQAGYGMPQLGYSPYQSSYPSPGMYPGGYGGYGGPTQEYFSRIAGIDQLVDPGEFRVFYSQLHPETVMNPHFFQMADNAFMAADVNGDGRINYNEFMNAYGRLRSYY